MKRLFIVLVSWTLISVAASELQYRTTAKRARESSRDLLCPDGCGATIRQLSAHALLNATPPSSGRPTLTCAGEWTPEMEDRARALFHTMLAKQRRGSHVAAN